MSKSPLWTCPRCRKKFVTRNMWHSCSVLDIEDFFEGKNPRMRELFDAYLHFVEELCGEVIVNVDKTRISFQTRTRFAGVPGATKDALICSFWLKRKIESPRFTKVEFIPPNNYVYRFRIKEESELDEDAAGWIRAACKVGEQDYESR